MKLKLVYFDTKGLAEVSRLLLTIKGVEFEDYRYPLEIIDPVNHVYNKKKFDEDKANGLLHLSLGKLPYLELSKENNKIIITQSKAIERYLARKYGFMGKNDIEETRIDSICEYIRDIKDNYKKLTHSQKLCTEFPNHLKTELEDILKLADSNNKPYLIGDRLSLCDISLYCLVTTVFDNKTTVFKVVGKIPKLRDCIIKISNIPAVREWTTKYPIS